MTHASSAVCSFARVARLGALALVALLLPAAARSQADTTVRERLTMDQIVAVVGTTPILWSEVLEIINQRRAQGMQLPTDSAGQAALARAVVNELVDEEILVQRALADTAISVADADLQNTVEQRVKQLREQFKTDAEFVTAIRSGGFGNVEEYRRWLTDQARRRALAQRYVARARETGRMISVGVSEDEITEAFSKTREQLPKRPATITFRQVVVPTAASETARRAARAKAESLYMEISRGGNFESIARRESMDPASKEQGGDLGWNRRGSMVPAFDAMMFALAPGQVGPVVETVYGFHIIRVDRIKPAEVKARHILIKPGYDSADVVRARALADSLLGRWRGGMPFDSLVAKHHDPDELTGSLEPFPKEQLPESYKTAVAEKKSGEFFGPFEIEDRQRGVPKFVIGQVLEAQDEGEYTVRDLREQIRESLQQEKSFRRLIDTLKRETYVSIRVDSVNF